MELKWARGQGDHRRNGLEVGALFRHHAEMWTGLQAGYKLRLVRYRKAKQIEKEVAPLAAA